MASYPDALRHNIFNLGRFSGRDTRGQFWPWAGTIVVLNILAGVIIAIPMVLDMIGRMQRYMVDHAAEIQAGTPIVQPGGALPPELMPDMTGMMLQARIIAVATIVLLAASVTRRLHDRDWRGYWGLLPVAFTVTSMMFGPYQLAAMTPGAAAGGPMALAALNSLCYWGALIFLAIILGSRGIEGPNRFGPDPSAAPA